MPISTSSIPARRRESRQGRRARIALRPVLGLAAILAAWTVPAGAAPAAGTAEAADRAAIGRTITAVYEVISGPPGQKRDFERMRALFAPGATLKAIGPKGLRGGTVEDYIARNAELLEREGFTERELGRRIEIWGGLATAWSAYDGRTASGSFHERGINSFQLVRIDGKWLVASILWQEETPGQPLPGELAGDGD